MANKAPTEAISPSKDGLAGVDLSPKISSIFDAVSIELALKTPLSQDDIFQKSPYATGGIGAVLARATLPDGREVVVKIQGPKPNIVEPEMIKAFEAQNKSNIIHAPEVISYEAWNEQRGYEIVVMEDVKGEKIIEEGTLATAEQLDEFFAVIEEYRKNCISKPWLPLPTEKLDYALAYSQWLEMRTKNPKEPAISTGDGAYYQEVADFLSGYMKSVNPRFMHGHVSVNELKRDGKDSYVIFSNLFWKHRWPAYDLVFAYSWQLLSIASFPEADIRSQMDLWLGKIRQTAEKLGESKEVEFALLERTLAQINFDVYLVPDVKDREKMQTILRPFLEEQYSRLAR